MMIHPYGDDWVTYWIVQQDTCKDLDALPGWGEPRVVSLPLSYILVMSWPGLGIKLALIAPVLGSQQE